MVDLIPTAGQGNEWLFPFADGDAGFGNDTINISTSTGLLIFGGDNVDPSVNPTGNDDDFITEINKQNSKFVQDPMCAYYLNSSKVDFVHDIENDVEGFVVSNNIQEKFHGMFWLKDKTKMPKLIDSE